jgi:hypothetical protein
MIYFCRPCREPLDTAECPFCDNEATPFDEIAPVAVKREYRDGCEVCGGLRGGIPGNENSVGEVVMCAYCHWDHALAAGYRRAKTPQAVECEASQSGGEAATPNPGREDNNHAV